MFDVSEKYLKQSRKFSENFCESNFDRIQPNILMFKMVFVKYR